MTFTVDKFFKKGKSVFAENVHNDTPPLYKKGDLRMKKLFEIIAGFGFLMMLFGGMMMNEPNLLAFLIAFGGVGVFAGSEYIVDWLEWVESH